MTIKKNVINKPKRISRNEALILSPGHEAGSPEHEAGIADANRDAPNFGARLRAFRQQRGWSLEKAAKAVGVPASSLSRIENRKMSPTLDLILKIVRAMGLHPYDVLRPEGGGFSSGEVSITRKGTEKVNELPNILYSPLHPDVPASAGIRPILVTLFARSVEEYGGLTAHAGEEFLIVLAGEIELHLEGRDIIKLSTGDSIMFNSHIPHAYVASGSIQAKVLIVATTIDAPFHKLGALSEAANINSNNK